MARDASACSPSAPRRPRDCLTVCARVAVGQARKLTAKASKWQHWMDTNFGHSQADVAAARIGDVERARANVSEPFPAHRAARAGGPLRTERV
jgi:hypothetical protein